MSTDEDKAHELGYTPEWFASGVLELPYLRCQHQEFLSSEDKNQEHYRSQTFVDFLRRNTKLSDEQVDNIFGLRDDGPDRCDLRSNRICEVLLSDLLDDFQLFGLAERYPEVSAPPLGKIYLRTCLLRRIRVQGINVNFEDLMRKADSRVQLFLLERSDLTRRHLEWLAERGSNKAIRNRASELLRSRKFRRSNFC